MTSENPSLLADFNVVEDFLRTLWDLSQNESGKFILASFGENPNSGKQLRPIVEQFHLGERFVEDVLHFLKQHASEDHRNFYFNGSIMKNNLAFGKKGKESDIESVLLLVADFDAKDDPHSTRWRERLPQSPTPQLVVETSPRSYQVYYVFDSPQPSKAVKPLARKLVKYCGCDPISKDLSHVWRILGLLNWPTKKKIIAGRSPIPFVARVVEEWN